MADDLMNCKCGGKVELDWGIVTEFYGGEWQDCDITCVGKCGYSVSMNVNSALNINGTVVETLVTEMWNRLQDAIANG